MKKPVNKPRRGKADAGLEVRSGLHRELRSLYSLAELNLLIAQGLLAEELGRLVTTAIPSLLDVAFAALCLKEAEDGNWLVMSQHQGRPLDAATAQEVASLLEDGLANMIFSVVGCVLLADLPEALGTVPEPLTKLSLKSALVTAVRTTDNRFGVLMVGSEVAGNYNSTQRFLIGTLANQVALVLENARLFDQAQEVGERYRSLVEFNPDTIIVHSNGEIVFINPAGARLLRAANPEELIGKPIMDLVHPDYREVIQGRLRKAGEEEREAGPNEEKFIRLDGTEVDVETVATPVIYRGKPAIQAVVRDITERKRAEEALLQSEEKLRLMFESIQDGIVVTDLEGNIIEANDAALRMSGYTKEEYMRLKGFEFIDEKGRAAIVDKMNEAFKQGHRKVSIEHPLVAKDGRELAAEFTIALLRHGSGKPAGFISVTRDITERKQAEQALRSSEERYRRLLDDINDGYVVLQGERAVFANKRCVEIGGYSLEEIVGQPASRFLAPEALEKALEVAQRSMAGGAITGTHESLIIRNDGTKVPVEFSFRDIIYEGKPGVSAIIRDITERKRAEEALRESEYKYKALFEGGLDGVFVIDAETLRVQLCNQRMAEIYGFDSAEGAIGVNPLDFVHPDDRERALRTTVEDMFEKDLHQVNEFRTINKDGKEKWISAVGKTIEYQGKLAGLISIEDITERKRAEEALRDSEEMSRGMLESAATGIYMVQEGKFQYVSPQIEEMSGYTSDEMIGTDSLMYIHPEDREATRKAAIENLKGESGSPHEFRFMKKDGQPIWILEKVASILYRGERATVGSFLNITERKRAEEELKRHAKRVEALYAIARTVTQTLDLQELLDNSLAQVLQVMDIEAGGIYLLNSAASELTLPAHKGVGEDLIGAIGTIRLEEDELKRMMQWRDPTVRLREIFNQANLAVIAEATEREGLKMHHTVPLWVGGMTHGALSIATHSSRQVAPEDVELLQAMANQIAVGIGKAILFEEVSNAAIIDGLTGLYNHRHFQERLEEEVARSLRFGSQCSLIMLDVDHFKIYNDLFSHVAGDEILKRVGQVLRDYTRQVDIACRYGGEEFTVILPHTDSIGTYETAERLRKAIETALALESSVASVGLTVSLGVASWPSDGLSREELIRHADLALSEAKQRGRNQTCLASEVPSITRAEKAGLHEVAEHLEAASLNTIYALAAAVDARDHYTYGHSRSVSRYAVTIGKALGLSLNKIQRLRIAALLHDIGKIGLSDSVIRKAGPLNEAEWEMMRKHSELGASIISHTPELADCALAIQHHHEWYDGSGYPHGLRGEDIPLEARIIGVADAYDTMTTPRSYRQTASPQEAIEELRRCANTQFDPVFVDVLAQVTNKG